MRMEKYIKKITTLVVVSVLFLTPNMSVKASEIKPVNDNKVVITEFDVYKKLNEEMKSQRTESENTINTIDTIDTDDTSSVDFSKLSEEEIYFIENYVEIFTQKIFELQELTEEELKEFNYTDSQIEAIKSFTGDPNQISAASSSCEVYGDFNSYYTSAYGTNAELIVAFRWNGIPFGSFPDIFAVTWSAPLNASSISGYAGYTKRYGDYEHITTRPSTKSTGIYAESMTFDVSIFKNNEQYLLTGGTLIVNLKANSEVRDAGAYFAYGSSYLSLSPSISVTGDLSFSFSMGVDTLDSARCYH
ncbi:hypothetical protein GCM10023142_23910 [Anaerocolumna aminovalerica]|uniref:Uncharacterized protein n=1 Tax=Anaerocolumna aminovalerica TaxID=1527 RepID=A0A1I5J7T4_9FIRM|nr:hypothetical protein [Anaerocolumna aminovalerica]SFO68817.1 hypothetical protein SAMN04489757_17111 [Anaerocolumna aminovalerica]